MTDKALAYAMFAEQKAKEISASYRSWTSYLQTAARMYKYDYYDQLLIHAQRPDATACASYEVWNQRMHRYIRRGSKGIGLLKLGQEQARLHYVFDIADTGTRPTSVPFEPWQVNAGNETAVAIALADAYGVPDQLPLPDQLTMIAARLTRDFWQQHREHLTDNIDGSRLMEYDEGAIGSAFRRAAAASTLYTLLYRCGYEPNKLLAPEDFKDVQLFSTANTIIGIGSAVSINSGLVLRQIERTVREYERSNEHDRTDLHPEGRLLLPESDGGRRENAAAGQVREDAPEVPVGAFPGAAEPARPERDAVPAPDGDRPDRPGAARPDDAHPDGTERRDGGAEAEGSDEVGGRDEQPASADRGNHPDGAGLQLNFLDIPPEILQIESIDQAESAPAPFAFPVAQSDIDHILRTGDNTQNHRQMIVSEFSKGKSPEELVPFLRQVYHGGNGIITDHGHISAWYAEDGIHLSKGRAARYVSTAYVVPWQEAAVRIGELLESGEFATNLEIAEAPGMERHRIAEDLQYIMMDMSDEAREAGYLPTLSSVRGGGFPEETARIEALLADPDKYPAIADEVNHFFTAYEADRALMRFHFHQIERTAMAMDELSMPRADYDSKMIEIPAVGRFITEDEVDAALEGGQGSYAGGAFQIHEYFSGKHTDAEKVDYLKHLYGIGGRAPAISGAFHSQEAHDSKGIKLQKKDCEPVLLTWSKVAQRIETLIRQDRYLTPEQKAEWQAQQEAHQSEAELVAPEKADEPTLDTPDDDEPIDVDYVREQLAARGIVNGEIVDEEAFQAHPFTQEIQELGERFAEEEPDVPEEPNQETPPKEIEVAAAPIADTPYHVGDILYLDNRPFEVDSIGRFDVRLRDLNTTYPIFRSESKPQFERLLQQDQRNDGITEFLSAALDTTDTDLQDVLTGDDGLLAQHDKEIISQWFRDGEGNRSISHRMSETYAGTVEP